MINVISFSGGRTSAYLCYLAKQQLENCHFIFMDTGAEAPETYEFIRRVDAWLGLNLVCIRAKYMAYRTATSYTIVPVEEIGPDLTPWVGMLEKYGTPYHGGAFCTDRMKTAPYRKYCADNFGKDNYITWLGIREDEPKRLRAKPNVKYLADISCFEKRDILNFWKTQAPFDLGIEEHLGNCVFCIKKSRVKLALAMRDVPGMAANFKDIIASDNVRRLPTRTTPNENMYRDNVSLDDVVHKYSIFSDDELRQAMRGKFDTNSCSESCEIL